MAQRPEPDPVCPSSSCIRYWFRIPQKCVLLTASESLPCSQPGILTTLFTVFPPRSLAYKEARNTIGVLYFYDSKICGIQSIMF